MSGSGNEGCAPRAEPGKGQAAGSDQVPVHGVVEHPIRDELFDQAVELVLHSGTASTSFIQRQLGIGYNRAAKLIQQMEAAVIVGPADEAGRRQVLAGRPDIDEAGSKPPSDYVASLRSARPKIYSDFLHKNSLIFSELASVIATLNALQSSAEHFKVRPTYDHSEFLAVMRSSRQVVLDAYFAVRATEHKIYKEMDFRSAIRTFSRAPVSFGLMAAGVYLSKYFSFITQALADTHGFVPPLGLSQGIFSGIVITLAGLFVILVLGLFWAGFLAKPKSPSAAVIVQHLVTFLSGALLGIKA
jgi:hypothetical protein